MARGLKDAIPEPTPPPYPASFPMSRQRLRVTLLHTMPPPQSSGPTFPFVTVRSLIVPVSGVPITRSRNRGVPGAADRWSVAPLPLIVTEVSGSPEIEGRAQRLRASAADVL